MSNEPTIYTIPDYRLPEFVKKLGKLNRKAAKLGCAAVSYTVVGHESLSVLPPDAPDSKEYYVRIEATQITVSGEAPKLGDWSFIAKVEPLEDGKTSLIHTVPGTSTKVDDRFRSLGPSVCEHCNARRIRRDTFVVCHDVTGEQKQVGRQCLADFTGINTPSKVALSTERLNLFDEASDSDPGSFRPYFGDKADTKAVLALTSAYISKFGWVPRSQSEYRTPTAAMVAKHFWLDKYATEREKQEVAEFNQIAKEPVHQERAAKVVEWIKTELADKVRSDYEQNLVALTVLDLTTTKHLGIVCSAVAAYQKANNLKVEYAKRNETAKLSRFVGQVGEKINGVKATIQFVKSMQSHYGALTLVKFVDENQNIYSWFASGDKDFEAGQACVIKGSIKGHKEYNGIQETQLTRVKVA